MLSLKKIIKGAVSAVLGFFAGFAVVFNNIFNKGNPADNPAGKGTGNEARPRKRLVDGVDADRFTRLCVFVVIGFVSIVGAVLVTAAVNSGSHRIPVEEQKDSSAKASGSFTLSIGGNIMPAQAMLDAALTDSGYQFHSSLSELSEALAGDMTIAGLCGQIDAYGKNRSVGGFDTGRNYPGELGEAIADMGINYIFGANQHAFANGYDGMCATISNLHVKSVGVIGMTNTDAQKLNTRVFRVNGVSVGLAGYNCIEGGDYAALTDEQRTYIATMGKDADVLAERAASDMAKMRSSGAEFVVVCLNWGGQGSLTETEFVKQAAKKIAEAGADVIVGYGPCVTLNTEIIQYERNGVARECYVFYSLGTMFGDNSYAGNQKLLSLKGKLTDEQKKAVSAEKKKVSQANAAMSRSMTVTLTVTRGKNGLVSVEQASYNPIYIIKNSSQGEENTHLKYMAVPAAKYVSEEERPAIFADDVQWNNCKAAFKAICALADKTDGKLVLNDFNRGDEDPETGDGKI